MLKLFANKKEDKSVKFLSFLTSHYQLHNVARLQHLESLGLSINGKKIMEFGAGIGDHSYYYLIKNCNVVVTEGRKELVEFVSNRFGIKGIQFDVEKDLNKIETLPIVDIIHCYGLLYHVNNPEEFLTKIVSRADTLFLETCVTPDESEYGPNLVSENAEVLTQAISGIGCRPNRKWLFDTLKKLYRFVYIPKTQPHHIEFPTDWENIKVEKDRHMRAVYIASNNPIASEMLVDYLPKNYISW